MPALDQKYYSGLYPLKAIHNIRDYKDALESMEVVFDETSGPLAEYAETLAILIEHYEEIQYPVKKQNAIDILKFLMEQNNMKQKDLIGILGSKSTVSEILNGKRSLNLQHINRLSEKFNIKASTFV
jgi:HTH-type transcriptional regulator/antitoxin HigA